MTPAIFSALLLFQGPAPRNAFDMIVGGTWPTILVLLTLLAFSIASWVQIFWKVRLFKELRRLGDQFLEAMERARGLEEAYQTILSLPDSPYSRVFRQGLNFYSELRPGALRSESDIVGLTTTQLEALTLVLDNEVAEEREEMSDGMQWLAIIGSISPLLGLMGTVIGVMNAFLGITATGSSSISAVAPGVAEALITTVAGLAVAIPAVIAYNWFAARLNLVTGELEGFCSEFIGTLAREGRV
jgi:biopolymer transport protein TolQ